MYFVLYDRFLRSIGETYVLESWSRTQRAIDFDEMNIIGEQIPYSADPFFVVVNDRQGKMMFSGLASTPSIDDKTKKTSLSLKDYMTLFNTEIIVAWGNFHGQTVAEYLNFILSLWLNQQDVGFEGIQWDVSQISDMLLDSENIPLGSNVESVQLYSLVLDAMNYYNIHCDAQLNVFKKTLTFSFKKSAVNPLSIRLEDFGIRTIEKSFGEYNRARVYSADFSLLEEWGIAENNTLGRIITLDIGSELSSASGTSRLELFVLGGALYVGDVLHYGDETATVVEYNEDEDVYTLRCSSTGYFISKQGSSIKALCSGSNTYIESETFSFVYPAKSKNFVASSVGESDVSDAIYDAVMGLAGNRYQENIDLDVQQYKSILDLTAVDFSYRISVYMQNGYYRDLPVGEIETDSKGKHIVRLGYRIQELTQEL